MRLQSALLVVCGIALAACSDDPTSPATSFSGSLSFNYTGAGASAATSFSANGSVTPSTIIGNSGFGSNSWALADVNAANGETDIFASVPVTSSTWNNAIITVDRTSIGASTIDPSCSANVCTSVTVVFGTNASESTDAYECELTSGSVNISSVTSTNVTGSFSGTGTCTFTATGATSNFTVTSGVFNTDVATNLPGGA